MKRKTGYFILACVAVTVFLFSANVIWLGDDYVYRFIVNGDVNAAFEDSPAPIHTISDIVKSQYLHYFYFNGRIAAHTLVQFFCGIGGHIWFAVCNAAIYVLLISGIMRLSGRRMRNLGSLLTAVVCVILAYELPMTPSMQINYVWGAAIIVWFLYFFFKSVRYGVGSTVLLTLIALLAGNFQETYSLCLSAALIVYWCRNMRRFSVAQWCMLVAFGIGTLLICLSPAALQRAKDDVPGFVMTSVMTAVSLRVFYMLIAVSVYMLAKKRITLRRLYSENAFYWNAIAVSLIFNLLVGVRGGRQLLAIELMSMLIMLRMLPRHAFSALWLAVTGCIALIFVGYEADRLATQLRQLEYIGAQYNKSADGVVYADLWRDTIDAGFHYSPMIWPMGENPGYDSIIFQKVMSEKYPGKPPIRIYPEYLRGRIDKDMRNHVYSYKYKPGYRIYILQKSHPARFEIKRRFLGVIPVSSTEPDFSDALLETPYNIIVVKDDQFPIFTYPSVEIHEK